MPFDVPNAGTLGFHDVSTAATDNGAAEETETLGGASQSMKGPRQATEVKFLEIETSDGASVGLPDGLSDGIVNRTIHLALATKMEDYPWTRRVPRDIFFEYVVSFANVNEARTNWRPLFVNAIEPTLAPLLERPDATAEDVVVALNRGLWFALGRADRSSGEVQPIRFVSGQTPLVYDPMSTVAFGYASCTGVSILLVNALRAAGVPARLVGTPAWQDIREHGNHNWVEVWTPTSDGKGQWRFFEANLPGGEAADVDKLERDPCRRWFCNKKALGKGSGTKVYAARLDREASGETVYPMAWDWGNHDVLGEDRTEWYQRICGSCS